jgi:hypothetical protein
MHMNTNIDPDTLFIDNHENMNMDFIDNICSNYTTIQRILIQHNVYALSVHNYT